MNKYFFCFLMAGMLVHAGQAQTHVRDSLKNRLQTEKSDTTRVKILYRLGFINLNSEPDTALLLAEEGLALAKKTGFTLGEALSLGLMGNVFFSMENHPKALAYMLEALKRYESIHHEKNIANVNASIATVYVKLGDYRQALNSYFTTLATMQRLNDQRRVNLMFIYIGNNYELMNVLDSAKYFTEMAYAFVKKQKDTTLIGVILNNLGNIYSKMGQDDTALKHYREGLFYYNYVADQDGLCEIYLGMANIFRRSGHTDSALYYAKLSLAIGQTAGFKERVMNANDFLADYYHSLRRYDSAFTYLSAAIVARESIFSLEKTRAIQNLAFEERIRQQELAEAKKQARVQLRENALIGGIITLFIVGLLLYRNNRQKKKANQKLQTSYSNVELLEEIGKKITSSLSVDKIISTVYENVNGLMDANVFGIGIYDDVSKYIDFPATYEEGKPLPPYINALDDPNRFGSVCFNSGKDIIINDLNEEYKSFIQHLPTPHEGGQPVSLVFLPLTVKEKKPGVLTVQSFQKNAYTDYHLYMLRNIAVYAAIALDNAYSYETLKATQAQLLHSEKMASLGELTAGIAHEIQNPLNFVNNFSEINKEMVEEVEQEMDNGNMYEVKNILKNIRDNSEKINHHGKRADAIVKGMLQHSRASVGQVELTDVNMLADEYLRLSYHGLRAKDKSFNARFETRFDPDIPKIKVVPQEIGRVILNLINNGFYAVNDKRKQDGSAYEPTVSVSTIRKNSGVIISVKDNGNGIPEKVMDKIFQPFFTTKPTGKGTDLGLSLSYDIVKAHGGELSVRSREGEGTDLSIHLPVL